jgi:hypothetical protein
MYLVLGLFFAPGFAHVVNVFPMPVLGVVLLFEAVALMTLVRDVAASRSALWVALAVAAAVVGLPYGYVVGLIAGTLIAWGVRRGWVKTPAIVLVAEASPPTDRPGKAEESPPRGR